MANSPPVVGVPTIDLPPTQVDITVGSQTPDPDRAIRVLHAKTYPYEVWYFLACFIFLVSIVNWTGLALSYYRVRIQRRRPSQTHGEPSAQEPKTRGSISLLRLPQALVDTFRALSFRWTIPIGRSYTLNLAEVIMTATYIAICLAWSLINTTSTKGVKFDPHYYANIAGNIASLQFPLIVALGMKNNIISFLTGVSFDKLIYLHGMTSRVLVVLIWLHAGGRADLGLAGKVAVTVPVIQAGILSGVALTLLSIVSIQPIRDKSYEFFLIVHFVLAFICVLAGYFHAASLDFGDYIWPSLLLWGLDRFIRVLRIAIYAFTKKKSASKTSTDPKNNTPTQVLSNPKLELLSTHFLRLTIPTPKFFHWRPGQSVYLTFPGISASPFEAHPFTIATIDNGSSNANLKFFVRVRNGVTKRLFNHVETGAQVKVLLDGPYSSPPSLVGYDTVLLISGGSGVAFTLPLFLDLIARSKRQGPACRRLTFIWTIRNLDHTTWIQSELLDALQNLPPGLVLNIHIFTTGTPDAHAQGNTEVEDDPEALDDDTTSSSEIEKGDERNGTKSGDEKNGESSSSSNSANGVLSLPMVKIHEGRADLDKLIKDEVTLARDVMSVNVCGTHALAGAVRKAIRYPRMIDILKGGPTISLHIEAFGSN